ncbi:hypothetical protein EN828_20495 [Mesorhizobium sp. M2D.F.Ca.ET.185.01.1.1]|uniref:hypothetical protein n=1 Tax=unclassified Mesorhizobium TaxID=325217 RepID=UPI000FCCC01A|nr:MULTISPECIES: hypothetical protein [unclassified Mesorhizobium]TGP78836.1 hypothetical protein EN870_15240 [bacterium M00.F.Ca.ET.227.01.1.1]TGP89635.1 hypothetical protein EN864_21105 [bacterium M00.F.Ca.ET.221.01.1.1]TGP95002.1 hypothetical protein EN865_16975 [bacterium M00.F.Ca.ET.222.01.1.1]TGT71055.1 hypothetical protein EN802_19145 [bacterium M00.F.Ca.ET.159.01.1.1]TGT82898.1 hypothetical protein EN800_17305 [bacterium M00.F.Ca.ET.157.01.1.1]TGU02501.1 hypothetical protein EN806_452
MTPHAEALGRARTAADLAAVIALLDTDLSEAVASRQGLKQAEDRAILGDGDLAAARAALDDCNDRVAVLERTIAAVGDRRAAVAESEARADIEALSTEIEGKAALLGSRWRAAYRLIEELREELFEADALSRAIAAANGLFDAAGLPRLKVSLAATRRAAMAGPRAAAPARLSRAGLAADRQLLSLIGTGGALDPRPALRAPVAGATKKPKRG